MTQANSSEFKIIPSNWKKLFFFSLLSIDEALLTSSDVTKTSVSGLLIIFCFKLLNIEIRDRLISISKELTKLNERIYRGFGPKIKKMLVNHGEINKGEFVAVVEGGSQKIDAVNELENYKNEVNKLLSKFSLTDVVQIVHKLTGITKNKVYKWILSLK